MAKTKGSRGRWVRRDDRLFTLEVCLIGGPVTERFARRNKVVARTIQIRGDQTLEDLHYAIFDAFEREDEHMYEFQFGGNRPMDPKAKRYVLPMAMEDSFGEEKPAGTVDAAVGSLGLEKGDAFGYWFDFGDDWWHQVSVVDIAEEAGSGQYPRTTERVGESPPQYVDWDEEDEE
jgi:hypothetical protein